MTSKNITLSSSTQCLESTFIRTWEGKQNDIVQLHKSKYKVQRIRSDFSKTAHWNIFSSLVPCCLMSKHAQNHNQASRSFHEQYIDLRIAVPGNSIIDFLANEIYQHCWCASPAFINISRFGNILCSTLIFPGI